MNTVKLNAGKTTFWCVMNDDDKQRLIDDLKSIATSNPDPAQREEVLTILARLSDEWPNDAELMRIRLRYSDESK
jgi:hypothetical protein